MEWKDACRTFIVQPPDPSAGSVVPARLVSKKTGKVGTVTQLASEYVGGDSPGHKQRVHVKLDDGTDDVFEVADCEEEKKKDETQ